MLSVAGVSELHAQDPFYKGKRLTVMINYGAGGPADIEGRIFARHIGRHIEGSPNVIVQNIDGAPAGLSAPPIWARSHPRTAPCSAI
jgi:tripartite-type tricarboxylate transporter receptor subunit TctC